MANNTLLKEDIFLKMVILNNNTHGSKECHEDQEGNCEVKEEDNMVSALQLLPTMLHNVG